MGRTVERISEGENFTVVQQSRNANSPRTTVFEIDGATGVTSMSAAPVVNGVTGLTITGLVKKLVAGANGANNTVLAGVKVGDKVVSAIDLTAAPAADVTSSFESTITVAGHIQQTGTNLSASTAIEVTVLKLS